MTWFAVYETATGRLRSSGSRVADTLQSVGILTPARAAEIGGA